MPIVIPNSLLPTIRSLPDITRAELDRILKLLMIDPFHKELDPQEFGIGGGLKIYAIILDGHRLLYRPLPDSGDIQLCGIGKID